VPLGAWRNFGHEKAQKELLTTNVLSHEVATLNSQEA
jgi:hypothetical protein